MEESKDLQTLYKIFRTFIYLSLVVEFFEYAINPEVLDFWGGILVDFHDRLKLMDVYQDGHMLRSKIMTFLMICVTCVGTRNKKNLEFNAKRMVIYPITFGAILMFFSVWVFNRHWNPTFFTLHSSTWIYFFIPASADAISRQARRLTLPQALARLDAVDAFRLRLERNIRPALAFPLLSRSLAL